jgi:predicted nucleic-acid-binding protein
LKAVDTNVLARFLLNDDPAQTEMARDIIEAGVFVPITVLLELGWLLQSHYGFDRSYLTAALGALLDIPTIMMADEEELRQALAAFAKRGDFADHIHLVAAKGAEAFVTFDQRMIGTAGMAVEFVR